MSSHETGNCTLVTASGAHRLDVRLANNILTRFCGLMLKGPLRPGQGLLITRCPSVHGAFMRYPIDVVYLDRGGLVTKCVRGMKPWRGSFSNVGKDAQGRRFARAAHTLELAAGAIDAFGIAQGDRLNHPHWDAAHKTAPAKPALSAKQRGSSMIEFTIVGPIITMLGLTLLQYSMLFFAKSQINYASFMAAREGSMAHADIASVHDAYVRALVPLYGGGQTPNELASSLANATADLGANGDGNVNIELLNPTKESFADWNEPALQAALNTGARRVIPNAMQAVKAAKGLEIRPASGQTIQDANLIKLRITHGYLPKVPFVNKIYTTYLKWLDPQTDAFHTKLVGDGRIPVVTSVTMHMQSDAIEPAAPVSMPGPGNNGNPTNPGAPPVANNPPPDCTNFGCSTPIPSPTPKPPPACNPITDPNHCVPPICSIVCCKPT